MRLRNSKSNPYKQALLVLPGSLIKLNDQLLRPFLLGISGILSIAIPLSAPSVCAEDRLIASDNSISEINTPSNQKEIHSAQSLKQAASLLPHFSTELSNESHSLKSMEVAFPHKLIAQAVTPTPQPVEPSAQPATSDSLSATSSDRWQFSVKPYILVPLNVKVDGTVVGRSASIELGLGDILNFDRAFNAGLRVEAQKDRWGIIFDGFYLSAKDSGSLGVTFPPGSLARFGFNLPVPVRTSADASLSVRQGTIDLAASYRAVDTSLGRPAESPNPFPRLVVAPILGLRINILRQELEVDNVRAGIPSLGSIPLSVNEEVSFSRTSVEPLVGAQIGLDLSDRWSLGLRGDVSGFNINAERNLTWNLLTDVQYHLSSTTSLQLGYRFNNVEFEDGAGLRRARVNLRQNGLLLGVIFRF